MARARKQWHQLSRAARDRAARRAAEQFGLSRRQARERYNRGTYRPFAKDPVNRIPANAPRMPVSLGRDLKEAAIKNIDAKIGDYFSYNRATVLDAIQHHASSEALIRMAGASEDELVTWASSQTAKGKRTPHWLKNLGWYGDDGKWHNIFWYH